MIPIVLTETISVQKFSIRSEVKTGFDTGLPQVHKC